MYVMLRFDRDGYYMPFGAFSVVGYRVAWFPYYPPPSLSLSYPSPYLLVPSTGVCSVAS